MNSHLRNSTGAASAWTSTTSPWTKRAPKNKNNNASLNNAMNSAVRKHDNHQTQLKQRRLFSNNTNARKAFLRSKEQNARKRFEKNLRERLERHLRKKLREKLSNVENLERNINLRTSVMAELGQFGPNNGMVQIHQNLLNNTRKKLAELKKELGYRNNTLLRV